MTRHDETGGHMRLMEADCEINYDGRGSTTRGRSVRLLMFKDDGSFLIHKSVGVKALNYMRQPKEVTEEAMADGTVLLSVSNGSESIDVVIYRKIFDMSFDMPADKAKSEVNGTEKQFQEWLSRPDNWRREMGAGTVFVMRELKTTNGAIDLLGYDEETGKAIIVEMKRRASKNDVFQVLRYAEALKRTVTDDAARHGVMESISTACSDRRVVDAISRAYDRAFADPELWLVAESIHDGVTDFCEEHGLRCRVTGSSWWGETAPLSTAAKTAPGTGSKSKRKLRALLPAD